MQRRQWARLSRHLWTFFLVFLISISFLFSVYSEPGSSLHFSKHEPRSEFVLSWQTTQRSHPTEKITDVNLIKEANYIPSNISKSAQVEENECLSVFSKMLKKE